MSRPEIIQRLLYLRNWECFNIFFLPACLYFSLSTLQIQHWQPYAYAMLVICVILAQGTFYWQLKLQTIRGGAKNLPAYFHPVFTWFKWLNVVLLSIYPLLTVINYSTSLKSFQVSTWANVLFLFAVIEHINYYHYQLSHDNLNDLRYLLAHRKIRRSPLNMDLSRKKTGG